MKKIIPIGDRVLIKPIIEEEKKYGSIIVSDQGKERPEMGEVIAVGPGRQSEFSPEYTVFVRVAIGDIVLVPKIGTIRVEIDGEEYYIVQFKEILAVIKDE